MDAASKLASFSELAWPDIFTAGRCSSPGQTLGRGMVLDAAQELVDAVQDVPAE